jgi:flagellar motor switch protein FliN/FliY
MSEPETLSAEHCWLLEQLGTGLATAVESMGSDRPSCAASRTAIQLAHDGEIESLVYDLSLTGGPALGINTATSAWKEIATRVLTAVGMESPEDQLCLETYRELIGQAVSLLAQSLSSRLKKEVVFKATQSTALPFDATAASVEVTFGSQPPVLVYVQVAAPLVELLAAREAGVAERGTPDSGRATPEDLGTLEDLEMSVTVTLGTARLTLAEAIALGPESVVQLGSKLDDLVVIKVDGRTVARGEVVAVDNSYAVRITHLADLRGATISDRSSVIPSKQQLQRVFQN